MKSEETDWDSHDAVVLRALDNVHGIVRELIKREVLPEGLDSEAVKAMMDTEAEYELVDHGWRLDVCMLLLNTPCLILEIKSKAEKQSASAWTSQLKKYTRVLGVPSVLVVAYDLGMVQRTYLARVGVQVVDLRKLEDPTTS